MKEMLVSVLMPVFNANPRFLEESVESILSQTYSEIELIVILDPNDHREDYTFAVLDQFRDDHRLRLLVNKSRLGPVASMNVGINFAQGEYIARMDSDDVSIPTRIEEQVRWLSSKELDLIGCWSYLIDEKGRILAYLKPPCEWAKIRKYLLLHNPFVHSSVLFSKNLIKTTGLYNPNFETSEDYNYFIRAFSKGFKGANIPSYLHSLREHSNSMIRGNQWKENRIKHTKNIISAFFSYGFCKPWDLGFLLIAPLSFFIKPSQVSFFKKLFGFCNF